MPIPKAEVVNLSEAERQGLEKLIKRHQVGQQIALRARIVLAAAGGQKNKEIAQRYHVTLDTVRLWRNRWVKLQDISLDDLSLEERLQDAPRPGAPTRITADQRCRIEALACEKPEGSDRPITHWTAREIADELKKRKIVKNISPRHAARLLKRG
ncbi:MAG TPA: helix-turn-helix domain-containing protein [Anaerolineales bacterium]|nr:helix-turn-helix domain-containing protein [Anaerolineales bacterium]